MRVNYASTKKGITSIYVVIFTTILFGIITLSFIRMITSERSQTSNDDLSQSAYDSAMAGVEDAKIAVNKYYECINSGSSAADCAGKTNPNNLFGGTCDDSKLQSFLYGAGTTGEVKIQETSNTSSDTALDQAYTCVILSNIVDDYRGTLTTDTPTKVIPLGINSSTLQNVKLVRYSWHSESNSQATASGSLKRNTNNSGRLAQKGNNTTPPTISMRLISTGPTFSLSDFNNSTNPNDSTMILLPSDSAAIPNGRDYTTISSAEIMQAGNSDLRSGSGTEGVVTEPNTPYYIYCRDGAEFSCTVDMLTNFQQDGNALMMVTMPYGDAITDFSVTLYSDVDGKNPIAFENVQVSVDSTGRANDLVRRVEVRLDPADLYFPYLDNEVSLTGNNNSDLIKSFWITANCWFSRSSGTNSSASTCANNADL